MKSLSKIRSCCTGIVTLAFCVFLIPSTIDASGPAEENAEIKSVKQPDAVVGMETLRPCTAW